MLSIFFFFFLILSFSVSSFLVYFSCHFTIDIYTLFDLATQFFAIHSSTAAQYYSLYVENSTGKMYENRKLAKSFNKKKVKNKMKKKKEISAGKKKLKRC